MSTDDTIEYICDSAEKLDILIRGNELVTFCFKCTGCKYGTAKDIVEAGWFDCSRGHVTCPTCGVEYARGLIYGNITDMDDFMKRLTSHVLDLHKDAFIDAPPVGWDRKPLQGLKS